MIRPKAPASIISPMRCTAGKNGNWLQHRTKTFSCLAMQARMASLAGLSMPNGFSPIRCLPAEMISQ